MGLLAGAMYAWTPVMDAVYWLTLGFLSSAGLGMFCMVGRGMKTPMNRLRCFLFFFYRLGVTHFCAVLGTTHCARIERCGNLQDDGLFH